MCVVRDSSLFRVSMTSDLLLCSVLADKVSVDIGSWAPWWVSAVLFVWPVGE